MKFETCLLTCPRRSSNKKVELNLSLKIIVFDPVSKGNRNSLRISRRGKSWPLKGSKEKYPCDCFAQAVFCFFINNIIFLKAANKESPLQYCLRLWSTWQCPLALPPFQEVTSLQFSGIFRELRPKSVEHFQQEFELFLTYYWCICLWLYFWLVFLYSISPENWNMRKTPPPHRTYQGSPVAVLVSSAS